MPHGAGYVAAIQAGVAAIVDPRASAAPEIAAVYAQYYASLGKIEIPLSEANFLRFGVSTTPTMLLVDGQGIVRMYNPGAASYETLAARIEPLFALPVTSASLPASH